MSKHQYEYRKAMDSIHVSQEWEDHMIHTLMNPDAKETHPHRTPRMGLIAVAAAACLTIGASAAETASGAVSDLFAPLFGTAHTEIIDSIGYPVGVSDSTNGITVTADAIIGDANNICVIFSLTKEDGSPWTEVPDDSYLNFEDSTLDFRVEKQNPGGWGAHGGSWFIDEDPNDNVIQFVEQRTIDGAIPHGSAKETLKNLCVWDENAQELKTIVKGKWTLRFDLDFEDSSKTFQAGQEVTFAGSPATVTKLTFSPIAFYVEIEQNGAEYPLHDSDKYLSGESEALDSLSVLLRLKDGRELDIGYYSGGSSSFDNGKASFAKSGMLNEVIPLEDMASIIVCGLEIPLQ